MEAADEDGLTPLDSAANEGHIDIVKALTETGANKEMVLFLEEEEYGSATSNEDSLVEVVED